MSTKPSSLEKAWSDGARGGGGDGYAPVGIFGAEASPEQLDLLRDDNGKLPQNVFSMVRARGPGRPKDAINKASREVAKFILHKYGCPVEYLASIRSMPLDQCVQSLMEAEGFSEREEKLFSLIEQANAMMIKAMDENWSEEKLKLVDRMLERIERAASSMKAKPGDLAVKALSLQMNAAVNEARYVRSQKPVEANVNIKSDGTILMGGAVTSAEWQGGQGPVGEVLRQIESAVKNGDIDASRLSDIRIVDAEYHVVGDDESDDDADIGE